MTNPTPEELLDIACAKIGVLGWAFYFVPETAAAGQELGLDALRFYVLGRGGVLGDVDAPVIISAMGYFKPSLVEDMWTSAKAIASPREAGHAYMRCAGEFGRRHYGGIEHLDAFCAAAGAVNDAADPIGLALYAGIRTEPLADDLPARAQQLVTVLREFRGSAHLVAIRAVGLDAPTAHFIRRPNDAAMFGWSDGDIPEITDEQRALLVEADALTNRMVGPAYGVLDGAGGEALLAGLEAMEAVLAPPA